MADLQGHYDRKYAGCDAASVEVVEVGRHPRDRAEAMVALADGGGSLMEIGAGSGRVMLSVLSRYRSAVGVELSDARCRQLEHLFAGDDRVDIRCANIETDDPLRDGELFDTVVMSATIEHLVEPISALRYVREHVSPGGRLILDTPNIAKWTRRVKLLAGRFPATASVDEGLLMYDRMTATDLHDEGHLHYFTYRSLRRLLLERAGFDRVVERPFGGPLARALPHLFADICIVAYRDR